MVAGQLQQVGADGVQTVAAAQQGLAVQGCQQVQAGPGALHHGHGDGAVEGHHRAGGDAFQQLVQAEDLAPVGVLGPWRLGVHGGDGGLELVGAERPVGQGLQDQGGSLLDGGGVPQSPVLLVDPDQALVRPGPGLAPGIGERITARGNVVKAGRTITLAQTEVFAVQESREKQIALLTATLMAVEGRDGLNS